MPRDIAWVLLGVSLLVVPCGIAEHQSSDLSGVAVTVKPNRSKVLMGDPIEVIVAITNEGNTDLFIGRKLPGIASDAAHVTFLISDKHGRSAEGHATVADR